MDSLHQYKEHPEGSLKRYNLVTEEEMKGMKWLEEKVEDSGMMDTYMDTKA